MYENSQRVVEYLLSQDFVDKSICNPRGENIYHVICRIRGAEELFSIIERKVPHHLLIVDGFSAFQIACEGNNIFIVKRVHEILETLQLDLTPIKNSVMEYTIRNNDIEVIKYVLSIDGVQLNCDILFEAIRSSTFDIVVYLLNFYICKSIPSHLHNQFHIFQFSNLPSININNDNNNNNNNLKLVEKKLKKLMDMKIDGYRIWHAVCGNKNLDVVQLIFSLKGIQPDLLNGDGYNVFLLVCQQNVNIKVIKYIHKLFPSFIHSQITVSTRIKNGASFVYDNYLLDGADKLKIIHYLYLNGIDLNYYRGIFQNIYSSFIYRNMIQYLKVISQDFDYLHNNNEHDDDAYRKPSFWVEYNNNNNNSNNNNRKENNNVEQSMRINVWKNRFDEHVLHHLSKMIQEWMLDLDEINKYH